MSNEELQAQHDEIWRQIYEWQTRPRDHNKTKILTFSCESDHVRQKEEVKKNETSLSVIEPAVLPE